MVDLALGSLLARFAAFLALRLLRLWDLLGAGQPKTGSDPLQSSEHLEAA